MFDVLYPHAIVAPVMPTQGDYEPVGCVIHCTSSQRGSVIPVINHGRENNFAYNVIDEQGIFYQTHSLDRWGYHCGQSSWEGLGKSLSKKLIGIELLGAGLLTTFESKSFNGDIKMIKAKAWFDDNERLYEARYNAGGYNPYQLGWFEALTYLQEQSLVEFLLWCRRNLKGFSFDYVLGHHEVSPLRKSDPSSSLSMTMPKFRQHLADEYVKGENLN